MFIDFLVGVFVGLAFGVPVGYIAYRTGYNRGWMDMQKGIHQFLGIVKARDKA